MSQRDRIRMSDDEIESFLSSARKLQVASVNADGTPHLVTMYYTDLDGDIAFWTYGKAQKAVNLRRDPRITCLVEDGVAYNELRGVTVYGEAELIEDYDRVVAFGMAMTARYPEVFGADAEALRPFVEQQAHKRVVVRVRPKRTASWDHAKT
ncbi:MAG: pyridoxamine 5'-phosphate oxidase family protein [Catenulisporales bacterium]|jgi:PPOX class probable F420-dependent enzyme|nr:pyridoxamine 5'-phosphate oxidase family protein [Catenulisporales bacterium]